MKLTATEIKAAKPKDKPYKLADSGGMYLEVFPNGTKSRWQGEVFGVYPTVTLAEARSKRDEAKRLLAGGGDPSDDKKSEKQAKKLNIDNTFEALAREWHAYKHPSW